ncbi:hypothetical protein [Streptomyces sp. NPDC002044]|uniref:hypothetical protein n=1 Tax=Streptomyces sp. NPDC002044 TaxID=3154662 RepID=UPI00331C7017
MRAAITPLSAPGLRAHRDELAALLVDVVAGGSSLGFLAGLDHAGAAARWDSPLPAARAGVLLLFLDTETGSAAERVYRSAGWTEAGAIPDYATGPDGRLHPTTLSCKRPPGGAG